MTETSITDMIYSQNFSTLSNNSGIYLRPGDECQCDEHYYDEHYCEERPIGYLWKTIVRVKGNPVTMSPEQADYEIHSWSRQVQFESNPSRMMFDSETTSEWTTILNQADDLGDEDLLVQFTMTATQDVRDLERMNKISCDKVKGLNKLKVNPGHFYTASGKKKDSYFKCFQSMISAIYAASACAPSREQNENPHVSNKKKSKSSR